MVKNYAAENIAAELRFVVSAIRRAMILSRGRPLAVDLARLREFAEATLDLVEKDDLNERNENV